MPYLHEKLVLFLMQMFLKPAESGYVIVEPRDADLPEKQVTSLFFFFTPFIHF